MHKQLGKGIDYREIGDKFGVGASTACKKVNTGGTDENLFRLVPMPGHGARVLPLELVPGQGAQISAQAPTKGYVQTGAHAQALGMGTKSDWGPKTAPNQKSIYNLRATGFLVASLFVCLFIYLFIL